MEHMEKELKNELKKESKYIKADEQHLEIKCSGKSDLWQMKHHTRIISVEHATFLLVFNRKTTFLNIHCC